MRWRYATKRMSGNEVPADKLETILEAVRLTATSNGLQPFTLLLISDLEVRKKIQQVAFNQPQIVEGSHLLVFAAWKTISEQRIRTYFEQVYRERNLAVGSLAGYEQSLIKRFASMPEKDQFEWAARQAYIGLGSALIAAAEERVDSTPMEGFYPEEVDSILQLDKLGLGSATMLALGYRDQQADPMVHAPKVRRPMEELLVRI
ncbi:Oxygen-insensitive NAD(P)H nitroreductase [Lunatimonas lonarensis]|uniref:Oxygen-insensitive NAD(P)H nitroreductase n=1 Tax=Lunatimonas lonarensis TaxID=1232681 RepID=R7ZQ30_9BACT|nr:Oxygen-insensitive NAD(P)H nitroreductase [Lunatimonas lonarensis]